MNLVLIGMRGSGKTAVGRLLAERLGRQFVEMDELIAARLGMSIAGAVARHGWERFREVEAAVCREVVALDNTVNATGGGVVLREENIAGLCRSGKLFWLRAELETLIKRVGDGSSRPSLTGKPLREDMEATLALREPLYRRAADFMVDTDGKTPEAVAGEIVRIWEEQVSGQG